ncbi:hypothetical protein B0H67DRAFT_483247 [Lasiosphaeris hirsuta]|uniref:Uncharacterized protein n=1 Tax=Lasiosphaeris hirsuta TaxID=260670 RepID=A0AA40E1F1_9PEZI|nr:hypothetical protein B0H67DRAFT_483247 [Lasiosphaeris hirsuta]
MARKPARKASRAVGASVPTPIPSSYTTPLSSTFPSTYASEAELEQDDVSKLRMSALTLHDSAGALAQLEEKRKDTKPKPFPFMDLPSELRLKVYDHYFVGIGHGPGRVIDLDPENPRVIHKKLGILRTCRTVYHEASFAFYTAHKFRLFPTHPRRFQKKPLLSKLKPRVRNWIASLELRLGPGWSEPPRRWAVDPALGLAECVNVRELTVFVECDPSDNIFKGFRRSDGFYEGFSQDLLRKVLHAMPHLERVYFDGWPGVKKSGAMVRGLVEVVATEGRKVCWGPERGWTDQDEVETADPMHVTEAAFLNGAGLNAVIAG